MSEIQDILTIILSLLESKNIVFDVYPDLPPKLLLEYITHDCIDEYVNRKIVGGRTHMGCSGACDECWQGDWCRKRQEESYP